MALHILLVSLLVICAADSSTISSWIVGENPKCQILAQPAPSSAFTLCKDFVRSGWWRLGRKKSRNCKPKGRCFNPGIWLKSTVCFSGFRVAAAASVQLEHYPSTHCLLPLFLLALVRAPWLVLWDLSRERVRAIGRENERHGADSLSSTNWAWNGQRGNGEPGGWGRAPSLFIGRSSRGTVESGKGSDQAEHGDFNLSGARLQFPRLGVDARKICSVSCWKIEGPSWSC